MTRTASGRRRGDKPLVGTTSAGGAVFRPNGRVLLLRRADERRWCLPKGGVEDGETPQEAALREIQEESGITGRVVEHLRDIHYVYFWPPDEVNYDKTVKYYLVERVAGTPKLERGFDRFRWCTEKDALRLLHYENDKRVVRAAFRKLRGLRGAET